MQRNRLVVLAGTLLVLGVAGCGKITLDSDEKVEVQPAADEQVSGRIELPKARSGGEPIQGEKALDELLVTAAGDVWFQGHEFDRDRLKKELFNLAETKRDQAHPCQPSERGILIRADRRAAWGAVRTAIMACSDPAVRIYRLYLAARTTVGGEEGMLYAWLPKDRGLLKTRIKLTQKPKITVLMGSPLPGEVTRIRILDTPILLDEAGRQAARELVEAIHSRDEHLDGEIISLENVPWGDVLWVYDMLVSAGVVMHGDDLVPIRDESDTVRMSTAGDAEKAMRDAGAQFEGRIFDELGRLTPEALSHFTDEVGIGESVHVFESLVIRSPEDRSRVRELLMMQEHTSRSLGELEVKIEPSPPLLVALARFYMACGTMEDDLRALTLLQLVSQDPEERYGERWWSTQLLILRLYDQFARDFESEQARENLLALVMGWRTLGVLERSPLRDEILQLELAVRR